MLFGDGPVRRAVYIGEILVLLGVSADVRPPPVDASLLVPSTGIPMTR
jgi:hypothetical protein